MKFIARLFTILVLLIVIVVLAAGGTGVYLVRKDFPQTDGTLQVSGLQARVDVIRDKYGVPHIYASNDHDLFFAQGYVHAQDRFWQMEFWRRVGAGRLSEILGPSTASTDRYLRTLGLMRAAQTEAGQLGPEERAVLEAYAAGVNAYLSTHKDNLGLEFTLLQANGVKFDPEPWTPYNSLTWLKMMAYDLGGNMDQELLRAQLLKALGPDKLAELIPPVYPTGMPVILPPSGALRDLRAGELLRQSQAQRALLGMDGEGLGSNNWVIAGSRSTTGKPLLANDPHLGMQMPAIWYEVDMQCVELTADCKNRFTGFSFAGVPGVIIGHNDRIAWGLTNVGPDVQDLYVEDVQGDAVKFKGALVPLKIVEEIIKVKGQLPDTYRPTPNETSTYDEAGGMTTITLKVRIVPHHGPLMSDVDPDLAAAGPALSLKWTALEPGKVANTLVLLDRAQNWDDFRKALAPFQAPSQNFIYADVDGHIGWQVPGQIPIRPAGCDGRMPAPGDGSCEWQGFVPYDDLPRSYDPPQAYIATANNAPYGPGYKYVLGYDWDFGYRAERIVEMITAQPKLSLDDLATIQFDSKDLLAAELIPQLTNVKPADPKAQQALEAMRNWDFQARRDRVGAMVWASFYRHMLIDTYGDELGQDLSKAYLGTSALNRLVLSRTYADPQSPWWDDTATAGVTETREQIVERALNDTVQELTEKLGPDTTGWTWGKLHTITFENQSLGQSNALGGLLKMLLNRGPSPVDGGSSIVNAASWSFWSPYTMRSGASMRMLVDLSNLANSRSVFTTGQSGHPYNPHYDDFTALWANGQTHPQLFDRAAVEQNAEGRLVLVP
jgi:penicillin amidase